MLTPYKLCRLGLEYRDLMTLEESLTIAIGVGHTKTVGADEIVPESYVGHDS